jgi:hypothetical protein
LKTREFAGKNIPLQEMIDKEYLEEEENTYDYTQNVLDAGSDVNKLP